MGRLRLTRAGLSRAGVIAGGGMFTSGMWLAVDLAAGLMTGGALLVAYCLLLTDVDADDGGGP